MPDRTILQLTAMRSTKYGGLERYFVHLAEACSEKGYRTVLQYEAPPVSEAYRRDLEQRGAAVVTLPTLSDPLRSVLRVAGLLRDLRPEIVHSHFVSGYVLLAIPLAARRSGARKVISTVHSPIDPKRTWHRRIAYNWHDHVLCVSDHVSRTHREAGVRREVLSTHYLGLFGPRHVSPGERARVRREFGIPDEASVIGCIGFDVPLKGFDVLLLALTKLVRDGCDAHLIAIGVDPARSALPARAAELGIAAHAHWVGIRDEGWRLLGAADLYAQPSLSEGLGLSVMEAMAVGLPVVASRVGGIPEVVVHEETGILIPPGDADALWASLKFLLGEPSTMRLMGEAGIRRVDALFNGERSVRALTQRYYGLGEGT